jgi:hypothetical protein
LPLCTGFVARITDLPLGCGEIQHLAQASHPDKADSMLGLPILDLAYERNYFVIAKAFKPAPINRCPQALEGQPWPADVEPPAA